MVVRVVIVVRVVMGRRWGEESCNGCNCCNCYNGYNGGNGCNVTGYGK